MNPSPEYENKRPWYKTLSVWLLILSASLDVINQVLLLLPKDSTFFHYLTIAATVGVAFEQAIVRASRNTSAATVEAATVEAALGAAGKLLPAEDYPVSDSKKVQQAANIGSQLSEVVRQLKK